MLRKIFTPLLQLYRQPAPRRTLRPTLHALHTSGTIRVFRRHSFLNVWEPLRENFHADESAAG
jgi:hypothetical protein